MFDLDAMQEADVRLEEVVDRDYKRAKEASDTAQRATMLIEQSNERMRRSAQCPIASRHTVAEWDGPSVFSRS